MMWGIFLYAYLSSVCLSWWMLRSLDRFLIGLFVFILLSFKRSLYILDSSFYQMSFGNIFSLSCGLSSHSFESTFALQKILISGKSILSIIFFLDYAFCVVSKKSFSYPRPSRFSPVLYSRSFIVLCFWFRSVIHFELLFMKGIKFCL